MTLSLDRMNEVRAQLKAAAPNREDLLSTLGKRGEVPASRESISEKTGFETASNPNDDYLLAAALSAIILVDN